MLIVKVLGLDLTEIPPETDRQTQLMMEDRDWNQWWKIVPRSKAPGGDHVNNVFR